MYAKGDVNEEVLVDNITQEIRYNYNGARGRKHNELLIHTLTLSDTSLEMDGSMTLYKSF